MIKKSFYFFLIRFFWVSIIIYPTAAPAKASIIPQIKKIPSWLKTKMQHTTWKKNCPVPLENLRLLSLPYWGFDNQTHQGFLIVNQELANEVATIFYSLFLHKFPIQQMQLMEEYKGNDLLSMQANNTSAFNCREITFKPGVYSQHSYGRAIDINPLINPYVAGNKILPDQGARYRDPLQDIPGKINKQSLIYRLFKKYDWDWGGNWPDLQDFQHFEKRVNGEKRNHVTRSTHE